MSSHVYCMINKGSLCSLFSSILIVSSLAHHQDLFSYSSFILLNWKGSK